MLFVVKNFIRPLHDAIADDLAASLTSTSHRRRVTVVKEATIFGSHKPKDVNVSVIDPENGPLIDDVGARAFIPFKSNSLPVPRNGRNPDDLWEKAYHFYQLNRAEFLDFYHKRSNVETTFSMVKAKFSGALRSKTATAQVNEVLVKILCLGRTPPIEHIVDGLGAIVQVPVVFRRVVRGVDDGSPDWIRGTGQ